MKRSVQRKGRKTHRQGSSPNELRLLKGDATIPPRASLIQTGYPRANYTVRELVNFVQIISTASITFGTFVHTLGDIPNATNWVTLFDRYRFKSVKMTFQQVGVQMNTTAVIYSIPQFITVVDFDDNTTPTSFSQLQRYSTAATHSSSADVIRHYLPRAVRALYISPVTTGYGESDPNLWLDCANSNIPHYALKWGLGAATPAGQSCVYNVSAEYVIEFAGQRG